MLNRLQPVTAPFGENTSESRLQIQAEKPVPAESKQTLLASMRDLAYTTQRLPYPIKLGFLAGFSKGQYSYPIITEAVLHAVRIENKTIPEIDVTKEEVSDFLGRTGIRLDYDLMFFGKGSAREANVIQLLADEGEISSESEYYAEDLQPDDPLPGDHQAFLERFDVYEVPIQCQSLVDQDVFQRLLADDELLGLIINERDTNSEAIADTLLQMSINITQVSREEIIYVFEVAKQIINEILGQVIRDSGTNGEVLFNEYHNDLVDAIRKSMSDPAEFAPRNYVAAVAVPKS